MAARTRRPSAINDAGISGLTAIANATTATGVFTDTGGASGDTYALSVNGVDIYAASTDVSAAALTGSDIADAVNAAQGTTGVTAAFSGGSVTFTAADGRDITIAQTASDSNGLAAGVVTTTGGTITLSASEEITLTGQYAAVGHRAHPHGQRRPRGRGHAHRGRCERSPSASGLGTDDRQQPAQHVRRDSEPLRVDDLRT